MTNQAHGPARLARRAGWVLLAAIGAGCHDPERIAGPASVVAPIAAGTVRAAEADFMDIAREIPSFAGYYLDESGTLVGAVAQETDRPRVESRLSVVRDRSDRLSNSLTRPTGIRTVRVEYSFPQLAAWRDLASEYILGSFAGVVSSDADEVNNRLTLGIRDVGADATRRDVLQRLVQLGVPAGAVRLVVMKPDDAYGAGAGALVSAIARTGFAAAPPQGYTDLRGTGVPFLGGMAVDFSNCTATLGVDYGGTRHMMVASHCTNATYSLDGHVFYQADGSLLGAEDVDPPVRTIKNGYPGRQSDAALAAIDTTARVRRGAIARPAGSNAGGSYGGDGTLMIDASRPFFSVTGVAGGNLAGQTVHKVGQTTGWTYGKTTQTCTDVLGTDGFWRFCSLRVALVSRPGDSGSPGFLRDGDNGAYFAGTLWGGNSTTTVFTYHGGFTDELGQGPNAITYLSDITVGYPNTSASTIINGTQPSVRWTAVSVTNSTFPTEYIVTKSRCQAYGSCTYPTEVYRGSGFQYDDYAERYARVAGSCPSYAASLKYNVEARNMGVGSVSGFCYELYQY